MSLLSRLAVQAARAYGILSSNPNNVPASYLVVAGGGGGAGGTAGGGGGGAGGLLASTATLSILNTYSITVGAGGNGGAVNTIGSLGSNSVISGTGLSTVTSVGGGYGGYGNVAAGAGGSGGGGGGRSTTNRFGGAGTSGQGNAGGDGINDVTNQSGAGGGGASAVGGAATGSSTGGAGGNGSASSISGSSVTYAGGGGGAGYFNTAYGTLSNGGLGGTGGGGTANSAGTANLGGGGGGGGGDAGGGGAGAGAAGGSGVVIISYTSATPLFIGGTLTTSGGNQIHTFTSSGTLSPLTPVTASYLVVAGGGGGGNNGGGGGGAGGLLTSSTTIYSGATYVVTVGGGGSSGSNGSNSVLSGTGLTTVTSTGGGSGVPANTNTAGSGGSGAGGSRASGSTMIGGSGTAGQGFAGGNGNTTNPYPSGGGGGASAVGAAGTGSQSGNGGAGTASSISGSSVTYAGGGGGCGAVGLSIGTGGAGGGGSGSATANGTSGTANLGGGGGGAAENGSIGGLGGSGTVIISYAGSQVFNGGLVTSSGGNTIHTFNATGALTPLTNNLTNSLRFRSSASAYLNRTPTLTTSQTTWTWSGWVKRGTLGGLQLILSSRLDGSNYFKLQFNTSDQLSIDAYWANVQTVLLTTSQVFRDPSAWYHFAVAIDSTQATAANRVKMYVNGNQITAFGTATYPAQNSLVSTINTTNIHNISRYPTGVDYFDGYMTDINFIDGQALEPYYFGNNDANGVWKPIKYTGMYGLNGFYLTFADTSALTTSSNVGLGKDTSGNGNYWTTNNISLTAGVTYDAMLDVPTNTSATVANYCVLNPLKINGSAGTFSNANLNVIVAGDSSNSGTMAFSSGKIYFEVQLTAATESTAMIGIADSNFAQAVFTNGGAINYGYVGTGVKGSNGSYVSYGATYTVNDIIGVAADLDAGTLVFYKNGVSQGTAYTSISGTFIPVVGNGNSGTTKTYVANFGQRPFSYTPPTGFVRLNTFNLPTPTILQGNKYMDATTYSAASPTNRVIVNQGQFKPDLVWIKSRSQTYNHYLFDSNRGVGAGALSSNLTSVQNWDTGTQLSSFNSNGYTISSGDAISDTSAVAWQWQAGQGSTSSNTSGSITSTVSVNATAGFSVVTYTGTGANATVGHGLGVAPKMVITKKRNGTSDWAFWITGFAGTELMELNGTGAKFTGATVWNSTTPTSTVFSVGSATQTNNSGGTYVAYLWAEIAGFSSFGSYTGNGSADGPFVYTGFRPAFIMWKRTDTTSNWYIEDSKRLEYNSSLSPYEIYPNLSNAEGTNGSPILLSNGFKLVSSGSGYNASGGTYIYAAFAESPFKLSNSR